VAFTADGKTLATGRRFGNVNLWDVSTSNELIKLSGDGSDIQAVAFSLDGKLLAAGSHETVHFWDVATRNRPASKLNAGRTVVDAHNRPASWIVAVAFSPDSKLLASGQDDGTVTLWDAVTSKPITWKDLASLSCLAFSPDGKLLATGSKDKLIRLWDVAEVTGRTAKQPKSRK
jgi:WD40 repeat protein